MSYPVLTLPDLSTDEITPLVMKGEIRTVEQFNAAALQVFIAAEDIGDERRLRTLAAIAGRHGMTYGDLVDAVSQKVKQLVREDLESPHSDDLPDTEIARAIMAA